MKKNRLTLCLLGAGTVWAVSSCQDYEPYANAPERIAYDRQFVAEFGNVDPNQTWDLYGQLAASGGIMTRAASADEVKVVDLGEAYYVTVTPEDNQKYQDMLPEIDVQDCPYGNTNLGRVTQDFVSTAHTFTLAPIHWNTNGVDVVGIYWYTDNPAEANTDPINGTDGKTYYIVRKQIYANKTHVVGVVDKTEYEAFYDYQFISDAIWNLLTTNYPSKYYVTTESNNLVKANDPKETIEAETKVVYVGEVTIETSEGTSVYPNAAYVWEGTNSDAWISGAKEDLVKLGVGYEFSDGSEKYKTQYGTIALGQLVKITRTYSETPVTAGKDLSTAFKDYDYLISHPIEVTVPQSVTRYGFYITQENVGTRYSESKLNAKVTFTDAGEQPGCYVATYDEGVANGKETGTRYLCFEDWFDSGDFDLNDVVFTVTGIEESSIVDNEALLEQALLVCEDLETFDFDFNDIALMLTYRKEKEKKYTIDASGKVTSVEVGPETRKVIVTAMAAGGANPSTVTVHGEDWGEIHELLHGYAPTIINAGPKYGVDGDSKTVSAGLPDEKVGTGEGQYPTYLSQLFAEEFITITSEGKTAERLIKNNSYTETGTAPQMMLLPVSFEWPQEMIYIKKAYSGFADWVADVTKTSWIFSTQEPSLVTDRGDFAAEETVVVTPVDPEKGTKLATSNSASLTYGATQYAQGASISLSGITADPGSTAKLSVTYTTKPARTLYFDVLEDGIATELFKDQRGSRASGTQITYLLDATMLARALAAGDIYIVAHDDEEVNISEALIEIIAGDGSGSGSGSGSGNDEPETPSYGTEIATPEYNTTSYAYLVETSAITDVLSASATSATITIECSGFNAKVDIRSVDEWNNVTWGDGNAIASASSVGAKDATPAYYYQVTVTISELGDKFAIDPSNQNIQKVYVK